MIVDRYKYIIVFSLFFLTGMVIYGNSFDNPFVYDDEMYIVKNLNIRDLSNLPKFFTSPRLSTNDPRNAGHYRPLVVSSYALNYAFGGLSPVGYHLVNLGFHVISAFLVFLIVRSLPQAGFIAAFTAGLIFLVHPFNSEAVNYSTARSSVMSGVFYLLGFYCWIRFREEAAAFFYMASLLVFAAGMLSKEVVITLPVIAWLYDLYFIKERQQVSLWRRSIYYLPFLLMVLIPYLIMRKSSFGKVLPYFRRSIMTQIFTELPVMIKHWWMFIVPKGFSLIHDISVYTDLTINGLISLAIMGMFVATAFYLFRENYFTPRLISFFMVWFLIVLLPTTIIPLNAIFQENRGYLAFVSFAVIAGVLIGMAAKKARAASVIMIILILIFYSGLTVHRNSVWGDDLRLWEDAREKAPRSAMVYAALSRRYAEKGNLYLSIETAKKGLAIGPENYYLHLNLARTYQIMGDVDKAIEEYETALRIDPGRATVLNELALLAVKKKDLERSERYLRESIRIWGDLPPLHYNMGVILKARGKLNEAVDVFQKAIILYPEYIRARYEMADALEMLDRREEAKKEYAEIIRIGSERYGQRSLMFGQDKAMIEDVVKRSRRRLVDINRS